MGERYLRIINHQCGSPSNVGATSGLPSTNKISHMMASCAYPSSMPRKSLIFTTFGRIRLLRHVCRQNDKFRRTRSCYIPCLRYNCLSDYTLSLAAKKMGPYFVGAPFLECLQSREGVHGQSDEPSVKKELELSLLPSNGGDPNADADLAVSLNTVGQSCLPDDRSEIKITIKLQ